MSELIAESKPGMLMGGLRLLLANKRTVLWVYLANLAVGIFGALPFLTHIKPFLDHSMASQRIAGSLDVGFVAELFMHANEHPTGANTTATLLTLGYVLICFLLAAGILYVFLSGEAPRLATVLGTGAANFWRFVRLTLFLAFIAGPVLGILFGLRAAYLSSADEHYVEFAYDIRAVTSFAIIAIVAIFLRLWFDIAEAMVVRNGIAGEHAVRRTIGPSIRLLWRNLIRACGSYIFAGALGWIGLALFFWFWSALSVHTIMLAALVAQIGIFLLLAGRVWQRGMVAVLVLSEPMVVPVVAVIEPVLEPPMTEGVEPPVIESSSAAEAFSPPPIGVVDVAEERPRGDEPRAEHREEPPAEPSDKG
jgi:hypothetical protein